jgi:PKD repeat protein
MKNLLFAALVLFCCITTAQIDLTSNLVICMPMDGNANDYSGNSNNGLVSGATPTVNRFGVANSAYHFDGINDFISVATSTSISNIENNDEISISAWCNINAWYQNYNVFAVVDKYNSINDLGWSLSLQNPATNFSGTGILFVPNFPLQSSVYTYSAASTFTFNQWHFYAITFSKSNQLFKAYQDGVLTNTIATSGLALENTNSLLYIGYSPNGPDEYSDGDMDELRIYNRALSDQEINALYTQQYSCDGILLSPIASFSASQQQICNGDSIVFTDLSTNNPTSWTWQIPGGTPAIASVSNPTIAFNTPGIYTISLISSNSTGTSNVSVQTVTVNNCVPVPVASFVPSHTVICAGHSIAFRDFSTNNPTSWNWQIPGGLPSSSSVNNPTITFNTPGIYTISLIASNSTGSSSVSVQTVTVNNCAPVPVASFSTSQKQICRGQSIVFTDLSTNNPISWNWQIPGGTPSSSSINNPTISFSVPGVYTASLTSSNISGSSNTSVQTFTVSNCVSLSEINNLKATISIYPNPSNGQLYIDNLENNSVLIYNVIGQKINASIKYLNENTSEIIFDGISHGIYMVQIFDEQGSLIQTSKVVIRK